MQIEFELAGAPVPPPLPFTSPANAEPALRAANMTAHSAATSNRFLLMFSPFFVDAKQDPNTVCALVSTDEIGRTGCCAVPRG